MLKRLLFAAILVSATCFAQEKPPEEQPRYYRLEFVVKEVSNGKVTNSRTFSTSVHTGPHGGGSIRSGDKMPVESNSYIDLMVYLDIANVSQIGSALATHVGANISSTDAAAGSPSRPILRQTQWSGDVLVPVRKPTTLFTSDGLASKTQMQLEVIATPLQ
jgi:hypothetical protein